MGDGHGGTSRSPNQFGLARFFVIPNRRAYTLTALVLDHVDTKLD